MSVQNVSLVRPGPDLHDKRGRIQEAMGGAKMTPARHKTFARILLMGALLGAGPAWAATTPSVLVVPARHTLLQLALDMVRLRGVTLISYRTAAEDAFHFYRWQPVPRQWAAMSPLGPVPQDERFTLIVGRDSDRTFALSQAASWPSPVHEVPSLDLVHLVNRLHGAYKLTPAEWRWLASRYGLTLKDRNYLRRKYGRYGPPGARAQQQHVPPDTTAPTAEERMDPAPPEGFDSSEPEAAPEAISETVEVETVEVETVEVPAQETLTVKVPAQETPAADEPVREEKGAPAAPVTLDIEPESTPAQDLPSEYK